MRAAATRPTPNSRPPRDGWVRPDFDWPAWAQTPEAERLPNGRGALEQATVLEVARLLTVVIRSDRFVEGAVTEAVGNACRGSRVGTEQKAPQGVCQRLIRRWADRGIARPIRRILWW